MIQKKADFAPVLWTQMATAFLQCNENIELEGEWQHWIKLSHHTFDVHTHGLILNPKVWHVSFILETKLRYKNEFIFKVNFLLGDENEREGKKAIL